MALDVTAEAITLRAEIALLKTQLKEERECTLNLSSKIGALETDLANSRKLCSIVFARWCLELFKDNILVLCSDENPLKTNRKIKMAWKTLFSSPPPEIKQVKNRMEIGIQESKDIRDEVDQLNLKRRNNMHTPVSWFRERSQSLYSKFSDILHDLSKLSWLSSSFLDCLICNLPDFSSADKALLEIVHSEIVPYITETKPGCSP